MRGEVSPCLFRCGGGRCERLGEYRVAKPADAAAEWAAMDAPPTILAGNGLTKYDEVFRAALGERSQVSDVGFWTPTGSSVILAAAAERDEPSLSTALANPHAPGTHPGVLLPVYTRLSDAEEAEERLRGAHLGCGVAGPGTGAL